jgi:hypothetical protein
MTKERAYIMRLDLTPHVGIGPIKLGAPRNEIRAAMAGCGLPLESERESMDYFCDASIQVEYEADGSASFIGVSSDQKLVLVYDGVDLFDTEAAKVFQLLSSRDNSGHHEFSESEYVFPSQIITLYEADTQYDRKRGEARAVWGQIGCGDNRYLNAVR